MMMYLGLGDCAWNEAPLQAGGKSGAAAAAQGRNFYFLDDLLGRHLNRLEKGFVAIGGEIGIERFRIPETKALGQDFYFERAGFVI